MIEPPLAFYVAFYPHASTWWVRLIPGRFKHVAVFAYFPIADVFAFFDPALSAWGLTLLPTDADVLARLIRGATVVRLPAVRRPFARRRWGLWCVPAVRHLVEIPGGALRPDGLLRDCLRVPGAEVIADVAVQAESLPDREHAGPVPGGDAAGG